MKELGLVQVTANGVADSGVSEGAQRAVEAQSVLMKGQKVVQFRQLQNVNTPRHSSEQEHADTQNKSRFQRRCFLHTQSVANIAQM